MTKNRRALSNKEQPWVPLAKAVRSCPCLSGFAVSALARPFGRSRVKRATGPSAVTPGIRCVLPMLTIGLLAALIPGPLPGDCRPGGPELGLKDEGLALRNFPSVSAIADLNGDGLSDLATGLVDSTLSVWLSREGREFEQPMTIDSFVRPQSMAIFDLEGDGDVDIAMGSATNVLVLANRGDGTFRFARSIPLRGNAALVIAAEVTGDGVPDLVATDPQSAQLAVLENLGGGSFAAPALFDSGVNPGSIAAADLDGDGDTDLAVTNGEIGTVSVLLNRGGGMFSPPTAHPTGAGTLFSVAAADLDADGAPDLALATSSGVLVLRNDGSATFSDSTSYAGATVTVDAVDLDGDGHLDLVAGSADSSTIWLLVNDGGGRFSTLR